jgi:HlyD family secretion protein
MKGKKIYILLGILVLGLTLLAVLGKKGILKSGKGIAVAADTVKSRNIVESVTASGKIYPVSEVKVSPDVSGEITELYVEEGQAVTKGQLLARIDQSLYTGAVTRANANVNQSQSGVNQSQANVSNMKAQIAQLQVQLDAAQDNYNRNQKLYSEKVISEAEFENFSNALKTARAALSASQASLTAAKENLNSVKYNVDNARAGLSDAAQSMRRTNIYAPSSGIVSKLNVKQGERVVGTAQMAGTEMLRISDMSKMKVEVEIGEIDIQKIRIGDSAWIEVDAYSKKKFYGFVTKIAESNTTAGSMTMSSSDQVSNYTVSIEISQDSYESVIDSNRKFPFRPGMSAQVEILTEHHDNVIAAPLASVTTRDLDSLSEDADSELKEYIFVVNKKDNTLTLTEVTTGVQDNTFIEITKGIQAGDIIVSAPYSAITLKLKDKDKVNIVSRKELYEKE